MVLETELRADGARVRRRDALALAAGVRGHDVGARSPHAIVRSVEVLEGSARIALELLPRFEYGLVIPRVDLTADGCAITGGAERLVLSARGVPLRVVEGGVVGEVVLRAGQRVGLSLAHATVSEPVPEPPPPLEALEDTMAAWRSWAELHTHYQGRYADDVRRSSLVLHALTYAPTGAVAAAATTSVPERVGGSDNWDYRYAWLRDASLVTRALEISACGSEAQRNLEWMVCAAAGAGFIGRVPVVFGVGGERDITERELGHLAGYRGSRPVRVGNAAWRQTQLDVPGQVVASAHLLRDRLVPMDGHVAGFLRALADISADRWREPDSGIWEGREGERRYLTSAVLCWVALDRALDMARDIGASPGQVTRWTAERAAVREAVLRDGWCERIGAWSGAFGSDHLDASVLMLPLVGFLPAGDERMRRTVATLERELGRGELLQRWTGATDGAFIPCSFWLANCLARAGEPERAIAVFEAARARGNDLGLLSEEIDLADGAPIGNFPQALSHVGLITAAASIDEAVREVSA
jgi:GH15 family glucan-1,4-alpha-glucosidase